MLTLCSATVHGMGLWEHSVSYGRVLQVCRQPCGWEGIRLFRAQASDGGHSAWWGRSTVSVLILTNLLSVRYWAVRQPPFWLVLLCK